MTASYERAVQRVFPQAPVIAADGLLHVHPQGASIVDQGWKLHVTATEPTAPLVLEGVLPVLRDFGCAFKLCADEDALFTSNHEGEWFQRSKFITAYPESAPRAVELADHLHQATHHIESPLIRSEPRLAAFSPVHYRWGSFVDTRTETEAGASGYAVPGPGGQAVFEHRVFALDREHWPPDPFAAAGWPVVYPEIEPNLRDRYQVVGQIDATMHGTVVAAVDTKTARGTSIKIRRQGTYGPDGVDAPRLLEHERDVLARLDGLGGAPRLIDYFEEGDRSFLVTELIYGDPLPVRLNDEWENGRYLTADEAAELAQELLRLLGDLRERGWTYGDLKPGNVLATDEGKRLVDFEMTSGPEQRPPAALYSDGFAAPEAIRGNPPAESHLTFSTAAVAWYALTGHRLLDGLTLEQVCHLSGPEYDLAQRLLPALDGAEEDRVADLDGLGKLLDGQGHAVSRPEPDIPDEPSVEQRLMASLDDALPNLVGDERRDLYSGLAGQLHTCLAWVAAGGGANAGDRATLAADALTRPRPEWRRASGSFVGEAGVGITLLRAAEVLDEDRFAESGVEALDWSRAQHGSPPELLAGTAGRVRAFLAAHVMLGDRSWQADAVALGEQLVASAYRDGDHTYWQVEDEPPMLGYAHGTAGIGDVLLDLYELSGESGFQDAARGVVRWLEHHQSPALADGTGAVWPLDTTGKTASAWWCHGGVGIGTFLSHAATTGIEEAADPARAAIEIADRGSWHLGNSLCHGLAGTIRFLEADAVTKLRGQPVDTSIHRRLLRSRLNATDDQPGYMPGNLGALLTLVAEQ